MVALQQGLYALSSNLYQGAEGAAAEATADAEEGGDSAGDDDVIDAEFSEEDK